MTTTHPLDHVEAYLAEVRERLADLPEEERAELLDDITAHVRELASEHGAENLRARLGPPSQFGDELRSSAGYNPVDASVRGGINRRWRRIAGLPQTGSVVAVLKQSWPRLEPAWWLVRGVFTTFLLFRLAGAQQMLIPHVAGSWFLGGVVLVAGAAASSALGERRSPSQPKRLREARIAAEVVLAVFGLAYMADASHTHIQYIDNGGSYAQPDECLRDSAGRAIGNLFAFDSAGKLIPQFFLTDQAGRPIDNLCPDQADGNNPNGPAQTSYARDVNGAPVYNVFPRAQQRPTGTDPNTGQPNGSVPVPAPALLLPQLAPPGPQPAPTTTTVVPQGP